jgi:hypothetical protein
MASNGCCLADVGSLPFDKPALLLRGDAEGGEALPAINGIAVYDACSIGHTTDLGRLRFVPEFPRNVVARLCVKSEQLAKDRYAAPEPQLLQN